MRVRDMKSKDLILKLIHDINSPLTSVLGYSDLLKRKELGEKEKDWVVRIHEDALKIKGLMKELSDTITKPSD